MQKLTFRGEGEVLRYWETFQTYENLRIRLVLNYLMKICAQYGQL